jgi:hypothetical protein
MSQLCGDVPWEGPFWRRRDGRIWPTPVVVIVITILLMGWTPAEVLQFLTLLHGH